jgi:uncharacterized protein
LHRVFPFTPNELSDQPLESDLERFMERGGFPEPFLADTNEDANRWRRQYTDALIREDVFTIEIIQNLRTISLLLEMLKSRVGSTVSYQSLSEDLECSPNTVKKYIEVLKALFIIFSVTPYSGNIARSIKKEPKLYFFDTGMVSSEPGKRLENLAALCLYKHVSTVEDRTGVKVSLHYLRTKEGREVDFVLVENGLPEYMVEIKRSKADIPPSMVYFNSHYNIPGKLVVQHLRTEERRGGIEVLQAASFLGRLE